MKHILIKHSHKEGTNISVMIKTVRQFFTN